MKKQTVNKHLASLLAVVVFALLFAASATQSKAIKEPTPLAVPTYSFVPPATAPAGSAKMTLLLINPKYANTFSYSTIKVFSDFAKSMSADMNQALTAKGYFVRGPFSSFDEAVYGDKKESDLMVQIEITPDLDASNVHAEPHIRYNGKYQYYTYTFSGSIVLSGKVNLTFCEPMTGTKLLAPNIPLPKEYITIATERTYPSQNDFAASLTNDPGVVNPLVDVMEEYYKDVFKTAWNHIDISELTPLKKSVQEIREKSNRIEH